MVLYPDRHILGVYPAPYSSRLREVQLDCMVGRVPVRCASERERGRQQAQRGRHRLSTLALKLCWLPSWGGCAECYVNGPTRLAWLL
eukprot:scaffold42691_cov68-Phaeocystis_antarctica.AAC.4